MRPQRGHAKVKRMQIECTTTSAAADALDVLLNAYLRPGREFHIAGPYSPDPPIRFTLHGHLPAAVVRRVLDIPDIRIAGDRGE